MKIGFIGLGQMGSGMAMNLIKAGHDVTVWNRSREKANKVVAAGAVPARDPVDAAQGDVVMTMLADDLAVEEIVFSENGILSGPALHVSHSTISVHLTTRLSQAQGDRFLSAPVFGRPEAAEAGKLFVVTAGADAAIDLCEPLFAKIAQRTFRLGDKQPHANLMKLCGNFLILQAIGGMAEAMTLGEKGGLAPAAMLEILTETLFGAPIYKIYGEAITKGEFRPAGFAAPLGLKDMNLASAAADHLKTPMPILSSIRDSLLSLIARHGRDIDWSGIALVTRENAGLK